MGSTYSPGRADRDGPNAQRRDNAARPATGTGPVAGRRRSPRVSALTRPDGEDASEHQLCGGQAPGPTGSEARHVRGGERCCWAADRETRAHQPSTVLARQLQPEAELAASADYFDFKRSPFRGLLIRSGRRPDHIVRSHPGTSEGVVPPASAARQRGSGRVCPCMFFTSVIRGSFALRVSLCRSSCSAACDGSCRYALCASINPLRCSLFTVSVAVGPGSTMPPAAARVLGRCHHPIRRRRIMPNCCGIRSEIP